MLWRCHRYRFSRRLVFPAAAAAPLAPAVPVSETLHMPEHQLQENRPQRIEVLLVVLAMAALVADSAEQLILRSRHK